MLTLISCVLLWPPIRSEAEGRGGRLANQRAENGVNNQSHLPRMSLPILSQRVWRHSIIGYDSLWPASFSFQSAKNIITTRHSDLYTKSWEKGKNVLTLHLICNTLTETFRFGKILYVCLKSSQDSIELMCSSFWLKYRHWLDSAQIIN